MKAALRQDLALLKNLAFRRVDACGELLTRFHRLPRRVHIHPAYPALQQVRAWLLSPYTLWPVDVAGLAVYLLDIAENGRSFDKDTALLFSLLGSHPSPEEHRAVSDHEHRVQAGDYSSLITAQPKFDHKQEVLNSDPVFQEDWRLLKARFDLEEFRDKKGIIRRRMVQERSFRPEGWKFRWRTREERFRIVFDAFCHKWVLYGMEGERPLLQKLSVNITPLGTMIFVPRYWSFDAGRDMKWGAVTKLHRARDVHRQGQKLSDNQRQRMKEAERVQRLWREARTAGKRGVAAFDSVIAGMGWSPATDHSKVKRLLSMRPS